MHKVDRIWHASPKRCKNVGVSQKRFQSTYREEEKGRIYSSAMSLDLCGRLSTCDEALEPSFLRRAAPFLPPLSRLSWLACSLVSWQLDAPWRRSIAHKCTKTKNALGEEEGRRGVQSKILNQARPTRCRVEPSLCPPCVADEAPLGGGRRRWSILRS